MTPLIPMLTIQIVTGNPKRRLELEMSSNRLFYYHNIYRVVLYYYRESTEPHNGVRFSWLSNSWFTVWRINASREPASTSSSVITTDRFSWMEFFMDFLSIQIWVALIWAMIRPAIFVFELNVSATQCFMSGSPALHDSASCKVARFKQAPKVENL